VGWRSGLRRSRRVAWDPRFGGRTEQRGSRTKSDCSVQPARSGPPITRDSCSATHRRPRLTRAEWKREASASHRAAALVRMESSSKKCRPGAGCGTPGYVGRPCHRFATGGVSPSLPLDERRSASSHPRLVLALTLPTGASGNGLAQGQLQLAHYPHTAGSAIADS
jgi:hypothetical protein